MTRPKLPKIAETNVLISSRRRCCICFGLERDVAMKSGQIAHLDRNRSNNTEENLAFLCFHHHDEFDSTTSQRKNLTIGEVKIYRSELIEALGSALSQSVHFGEVSLPKADPYAGHYVRIGKGDSSAEMSLLPLPDTYEGLARYFVTGEALHGISREYGPNMGTLEFLAIMHQDNIIEHLHSENYSTEPSTTTMTWLEPEFLKIDEDNVFGEYGMGVTFQGLYKRVR